MAYITLNKNNFFHNLSLCTKKVKDKSKLAIVLKDNAYGHGILEIASMACEFGLTKAVVRTIDEAKKIENYFKQILILADTPRESLSHTFHITINTIDDIDVLPQGSQIHLKINSGMNRNGIEINQLKGAILRALERNLKICGIFTHHQSADELNNDFFIQKEYFKLVKKEASEICEKLNLAKIQFHCANSAALFRLKDFDEDFARIGIAAYGYSENHPSLYKPPLKPVLSLYANKITTRTLQKNHSIGYGGTFVAKKDMEVSTYDIGYADGFHRISDNKTYYLNQDTFIVGRVSMDNISINSTKDKICIFDDVSSLAKLHETISYEMLTSLKSYIKRFIV